MRKFIWRIAWAFGDNNNMWLLLSWTLFFGFTIFNLIVFGFGFSPEYLEPEKESVFVSFKKESWSMWFWQSGIIIWFWNLTVYIWSWLSYLSWRLWLLLLITSILSFVFLFDEISRAWQAAYEKLAERRGSKVRGPAPVPTVVQAGAQATPQPTAPTGGVQQALRQPLTFRSFLIWEFLIDFLTELSLFRR